MPNGIQLELLLSFQANSSKINRRLSPGEKENIEFSLTHQVFFGILESCGTCDSYNLGKFGKASTSSRDKHLHSSPVLIIIRIYGRKIDPRN